MNRSILFVDDEQQILTGIHRQFDEVFDVTTANSGILGLEEGRKKKFAVVVSDYKMPEMNGIEFLTNFREVSPDTVRIMLTGQADLEAVISIINEGNIFRMLTKPCPPVQLIKNIKDGLALFSTINAEKELLTKTLTGVLQVMTDLLVLVKPQAFNRSIRVREIAKKIVNALKLENAWQIEIAAMLSQVGCVTVPDDILEKIWRDLPITDDASKTFYQHAKTNSDIISKIPRLEEVAEIIAYQNKHFDGGGFPEDGRKMNDIPLGSRILKVALDYDQLLLMEKSRREALNIMKSRKGFYDADMLSVLDETVNETGTASKLKTRKVMIDDLTEDMYLADDLVASSGIIIGERKQRVTRTLIVTLKNYAMNNDIREPVTVLSIV